MDSSLLHNLQQYGFSEKESQIYLTLLELGSSIASSLARRTGINRSTTYSILEDLKRRGIVTEIVRNEVKYYSVINPEQLFKKWEEKYELLKAELPSLLAVTNKFNNRTRTQFFEGLEGLKQIFEEVLEAGEEMEEPYLSFVGADHMDPKVEKYIHEEFIPRRLKIKTETKAIVSKDTSQYLKYHEKKHNTLVVEKPLFNLGNEIVVFGENKVAVLMYSTEEMSGLIIESQTLHDALRSVFELVWDVYKDK